MKKRKSPVPTNLSSDVIESVRRHGLRKCGKDIIKSVLFWGIGLGALFATSAQTPFFTPASEPFWFALVILLITAIPIVWWRPYRILTVRDFRGTVVSYRNKRGVEPSESTARGVNVHPRLMNTVDVYIIKVQDARGRKRTFTFKRENAAFGRVYNQKGDLLYVPRFSEIPFNESRPLPRPMCLWCGSIGASNEDRCTTCDSPYALPPEEATSAPTTLSEHW